MTSSRKEQDYCRHDYCRRDYCRRAVVGAATSGVHFSHFTQVDKNVREDIGEELTTERTGFLQENLPPSFDASAVLSQQLCNAEPLGAGETGENSSVRVSFGLVVFYIKKKRFS